MSNSTTPMRTKLRNLPVLKGSLPDAALESLPDDPHQAFEVWISGAIDVGVPELHAMTVSTVDEAGCPDSRVLILKNVDARGWHFAVKSDKPQRTSEQTHKSPWAFIGPNLAVKFESEDELSAFLARNVPPTFSITRGPRE
ncbi:hypothetical protein CLAIMM_14542 [Cladophialophora immunda]|nr:hypothetical protein CLAIMM_14542 [Cladophialophora immunda]